MTQPNPAPTDPTPPAGDPPAPVTPGSNEPLGEPGKKALTEERERADAERKRANTAEAKVAAYEKAERDKADADKSEAEKRAAAEQRATDAELRALRLEVAAEKGLTPAQAKRLIGATRDELAADADEILAAFTPATPGKPAGPAPDPSQGPKGAPTTPRPTSLGEAVGAAYKKA